MQGREKLTTFVYLMMKRLALILSFVFLSISLSAQIIIPEGVMSRKKDMLLINGTAVNRDQLAVIIQDIDGQDYTALWNRAENLITKSKNLYRWGAGVGIFGLGAEITGFLLSGQLILLGSIAGMGSEDVEFSDSYQNTTMGAICLALAGHVAVRVGVVILITSAVIRASGRGKMDSIVEKYNQSTGYLSFGPTNNGIGLSYRF